MTGHGSHPSELAWARHLSGELGWLAAWRLRRHLAGCVACRAREAEDARERAAFEASDRRRSHLAALGARSATALPSVGRRWSPAPWLAFGAASATALFLLLRPTAPPELAAKGGDRLTIFRDVQGVAALLGARCAPGDRLIARYQTGQAYLLLLERDGQGNIQVLFPQDGAASERLPAGEGTTPTSWILDATLGRECFAAFFSGIPVEAAAARRALQAAPAAPSLAGAVVRVECCDKAAP